MRSDPSQVERPMALMSGPAAGAGQADAAVAVPRVLPLGERLSIPRPRLTFGPLAARIALGTIAFGALAVVVFAAAAPSALVPRSFQVFPGWEAGPLHALITAMPGNGLAKNIGLSTVLVAMLVAYGVVLAAARTLSMRTIAIAVVVLHLILLMSPPLQLTDLFNYLGYARLGSVHHLNPYTNVIAHELHDPLYRFTTWHHLRSPYGPLFTAISYPIARLPIPVAYWALKLLTVLLSLCFVALVWRCARQLGRDPRFAVLFVAANPIYLIYAIGGFHNDFFMLVPSTAAISLLLARRDRSAGAALMLAVAVKFTAVLLLPFLLLAARPAKRRIKILLGAVLAAIPLAALYIALFGFSLPNLQDQSTLLTPFSIPNLFGDLIGIGGGTPGLLRVANVALVLFVAWMLRRRGDWLSGAGWATLALIASLAWLVPWYVVWLLPLAALTSSIRLRRAAAAFSVFVVFAFMPVTGIIMKARGINLMAGSAGHDSSLLQTKLEQ